MKKKNILQQGAEAVILLNKKGNSVIKKRIGKSYRIPEIDERLIKSRTKSEKKLLEKASNVINVPKIINEDNSEDNCIEMKFIGGKRLSENLNSFNEKEQKEMCKKMGEMVAKLHNSDIIHGDLTTSNMILSKKEKKIYFIDFGLGMVSHKFEDKAVDLHLLKEALIAKHFENWEILFGELLKGYRKEIEAKLVLERLKNVEKRGRYKY